MLYFTLKMIHFSVSKLGTAWLPPVQTGVLSRPAATRRSAVGRKKVCVFKAPQPALCKTTSECDGCLGRGRSFDIFYGRQRAPTDQNPLFYSCLLLPAARLRCVSRPRPLLVCTNGPAVGSVLTTVVFAEGFPRTKRPVLT